MDRLSPEMDRSLRNQQALSFRSFADPHRLIDTSNLSLRESFS